MEVGRNPVAGNRRQAKGAPAENLRDGKNEQQVGVGQYEAYGWFGDDYVLYSKDGSELYVAAAGAQLDGTNKVADYFSQRGPGY